MSFELKCAVNSVALKLMLVPFISYSLLAVLACQHGGVNRMGHVTAGALYAPFELGPWWNILWCPLRRSSRANVWSDKSYIQNMQCGGTRGLELRTTNLDFKLIMSSSSFYSICSPKDLWPHRLHHNSLFWQIHHDPLFHLLIQYFVTLLLHCGFLLLTPSKYLPPCSLLFL